MARDLILDVVARKNSKDLSTLADEFDRLAKQTDDFGNKLNKTTTFSKFLEEEITKTKAKVKELGAEFESTGSKDVFASLRGAERNLKSLDGIKKDLTRALDDGVKDAEPSFAALAGKVPPLIAGGVAAGVALSGPILLGAAGLAGIGLGIAAQIHSPAVVAALERLKQDAGVNLRAATASFGPVLEGDIDKVEQSFRRIAPTLKAGFDAAAPALDHLVEGVTGLAEKAAPGFAEGMKGGAVVLDRISSDLPGLGRIIGDAFGTLAQDAKGGADAVHQMLVGTEGLVTLIGVAGDEFEKLDELGNTLTFGHLGDVTLGPFLEALDSGKVKSKDLSDTLFELAAGPLLADALNAGKAGDATTALTADFSALGSTAVDTASSLDALNTQLDETFHKHMSAQEAALGYADALRGLKDSIRGHTGAWNENTAAGSANWHALEAAIREAELKRQADIANGKDAAQAAAEYNKEVDQLLGIARSAGASKAALDAMKGEYTIDVTTVYRTVGNAANNPKAGGSRYPGGRASGGVIEAFASGGVFDVGEQGPERLIMPAMSGPAYVTPNSAINGAANSGGNNLLGVIEVRVTNGITGELIRTELVNVARQRGYRSVDALLPVGSAR